MFSLVDCNNFYASCQRVFDPKLEHRPIVVLSNNDGCVIARSNEAKKLGIIMGAPAFQFEKTFEEKGIVVFSSNYALYGDMSNRVMNTLADFTPDIQVYSIDEAFLKFYGFENYNLTQYGQEIHQWVKKCTGIPISVGFAETKALAKVANKIAKKFPDRTGNAYVIDTRDKMEKALRWTEIGDVWGIGRRYADRLQRLGIKNAWQFTQMPDEWVLKNMTVVGLRLKRDLSGLPTLDFEDIKPKQNISTTRSFEGMTKDFDFLRERIATYSYACAEKLRNQKSNCNLVTVFLNTNRFREDLAAYNPCLTVATGFPTSSALDLNGFAQKALKLIYKEGYHYKKAGVIISAITPNESRQLNMFYGEDPRHMDLMQVMDKINRRVGNTKVMLAAQDLGRKWKMKQERLSPYYTTRWPDLITVKC
jgi:DNA polymerase V